MSDEELAAIRARAEAATPGPWSVSDGEFVEQSGTYMAICRVNNPVVNDWRRGKTVDGGPGSNKPNKEFIAHAREDVPALLAENAALRVTAQQLNDLLVVVKDNFPEVFATINQAIDELASEEETS